LPNRFYWALGRSRLVSLSDAAFDKAYADNEVAYHKAVDDALSKTLIPDAQNADRGQSHTPVGRSEK